ncbi:hypothetical protein ACFLZG_04885 [Thermodesulfobacteriota bacterium]
MKKVRLMIPLLFLSVILFGWACGKKAQPQLIKNEFFDRVADLKGELREGDIYLSGRIKGLNGASGTINPAKGCRVYYGQYSFDNAPCEGCPIKYGGYHEFGPEVIKGKDFLCILPGKFKAQIYFFKVHLVGEEGTIGPSSNVIKVKVEG